MGPFEDHRFTEVEVKPARQRQVGEGPEEGQVGRHREVGRAEELRDEARVDHARDGLLGPDDGQWHDGRAGLKREPHEAATEPGQLVALGPDLAAALRALGEDEDGVVGLEEVSAVDRVADHDPRAHEELVQVGDGREPALGHGA